MSLALYAKNQGLDLQGYKCLDEKVKAEARRLLLWCKDKFGYAIDTGMYFGIRDLHFEVESELVPYVIHQMKNIGFEFIENNEYWRL